VPLRNRMITSRLGCSVAVVAALIAGPVWTGVAHAADTPQECGLATQVGISGVTAGSPGSAFASIYDCDTSMISYTITLDGKVLASGPVPTGDINVPFKAPAAGKHQMVFSFSNGQSNTIPFTIVAAPAPKPKPKPKPLDPFRNCLKPTAMQRTVICVPEVFTPGKLIVRDSKQRIPLKTMIPVTADFSTSTNFAPGRYTAAIIPDKGRSKCTVAAFTVTKTSRSLVKITCRR